MTKILIDRSTVEQALEALEEFCEHQTMLRPIEKRESLKAALAEPQEPNLSRCPKCNGPADNGHDREVPPNPYYCTKCMAEPVAWRWGYRSVTTGEMDWRGYVEIAAHPNLRSPAIIMEPLYTAQQALTEPVQEPDSTYKRIGCVQHDCEECQRRTQRKPLSEEEIFKIENDIPDDVIGDRAWTICFARAVERAHGIGGEG